MSGRSADPGDLARRAEAAVAGFTSTGSKTPDAMFGGSGGPTHLASAFGVRVRTADGLDLLDWTMALGAVGLGYGHPRVVEAVERAIRGGGVGPFPHRLEVEVAERLCAAYPGAAQARFLKTGAEAVAAAVRIARTATGRDRVVHAGYSGWLDGPTTGAGVPAATAALWTAVPFDDVGALETAVARGEPPAAILLEPVVEREPSAAWLAAARRLAGERTILIFDEIKTGFRLGAGGAAARWGVTPDLAVLGKALANGFPLAAVVGPRDLMARVRNTWISSTLATEFVALAAAGAVLDVWHGMDVARYVADLGRALLEGLAPLAVPGLEVCGLPEMWFLRFADAALEHRFLLGCVRRGVLLKRGGYNFPSLSHRRSDVDETLKVVREALSEAGR